MIISYIYTFLEFTKIKSYVKFCEFCFQHRLPKLSQGPMLKCSICTLKASLRVFQKSPVTKSLSSENIVRRIKSCSGLSLHGGWVRECKFRSVEMKGECCSLKSNTVHLDANGIFPETFLHS